MRSKKAATFNELQKSHQTAFGETVSIWQSIPAILRKTWTPLIRGTKMSEYNKFIGTNADRRKRGEYMTITPGTGMELPAGLSVSAANGTGSIQWDTSAPQMHCSVAVEKTSAESGKVSLEFHFDLPGTNACALTGIEIGKEHTLYCIMSDKPFEKATMFTKSQGFRVTL